MTTRHKHRQVLLMVTAFLAAYLLTGCSDSAPEPYHKETYTYKVVEGHEIRADVYHGPGEEVRPAIIWLHPGALMVGSREWLEESQLELYLEAGYVVLAVDYRLAPEAKLDEIVADVEDAFAWVRSQGPELFRIDPDRVALVGHSAGAYLALTAGSRVVPPPKALISFYGYGEITGTWLTEPSAHYGEGETISRSEAFQAIGDQVTSGTTGAETEGRFQLYEYCRQQGIWTHEVSGHDPAAEGDWFAAYEALRNVSPVYPPTLLLHGEGDTDVPFEQSELMANALGHHGVEHQFIAHHSWGHMFDSADPNARAVQKAFDEVLAFLDRHLK